MIPYAAVVLAAGRGTRMRSKTPKVLHRICGKEMVRLVAESAAGAGLNPIVVVTPQDSRPVLDCLDSGVICAQQQDPLGSGHALLQAKPRLQQSENVVVLNGDVPLILPKTLKKLISLHHETGAYVTLLTATNSRPNNLGKVLRSSNGRITHIVEEPLADKSTLSISEVNVGIYCFRAPWVWDHLSNLPPSLGEEIFLTDLIAVASQEGKLVESLYCSDSHETLGVNTRVQLAAAETELRDHIRRGWLERGVTMPEPSSVYIDATAHLGEDTTILPNTHITGATRIGRDCEVGPNSIVSCCTVGNRCKIVFSVVEGSTLDDEVAVGPFSHVRSGSHLEKGVYLGNFTEVKYSRLGPGTKSGHFSYIGDADVGSNVNIGAGTVTCNYDGQKKNRTTIDDEAFIGSDSMLVAPINIGARSVTGAGSVVTSDVPPDSLAIGVPAKISPKKIPKRNPKPNGV